MDETRKHTLKLLDQKKINDELREEENSQLKLKMVILKINCAKGAENEIKQQNL